VKTADLIHFACVVTGGGDAIDVQVACDLVRLALEGGVDDGSHPLLRLLDNLQQGRLQAPLQPCTSKVTLRTLVESTRATPGANLVHSKWDIFVPIISFS